MCTRPRVRTAEQRGTMGTAPGEYKAKTLNELLGAAGDIALESRAEASFESYLEILLRWNSRTNLTAIRNPEGILARHFVESIVCARALPRGIRTLLDFGSGAGFPGIPIALCRPEIAVTLAESQGKKAAFLREAVRVLGIPVAVHGGRAESLSSLFECVAMRAVDRMEEAIGAAAKLVAAGGWLAVMTTRAQLDAVQSAAGAGFDPAEVVDLPGIEDGAIALARKRASSQS